MRRSPAILLIRDWPARPSAPESSPLAPSRGRCGNDEHTILRWRSRKHVHQPLLANGKRLRVRMLDAHATAANTGPSYRRRRLGQRQFYARARLVSVELHRVGHGVNGQVERDARLDRLAGLDVERGA